MTTRLLSLRTAMSAFQDFWSAAFKYEITRDSTLTMSTTSVEVQVTGCLDELLPLLQDLNRTLISKTGGLAPHAVLVALKLSMTAGTGPLSSPGYPESSPPT